MILFQENARTEGWTQGQKDRQTLFYRTLLHTAESPKSTGGKTNQNRKNRRTKSKRIGYKNTSHTLMHGSVD